MRNTGLLILADVVLLVILLYYPGYGGTSSVHTEIISQSDGISMLTLRWSPCMESPEGVDQLIGNISASAVAVETGMILL